MIYVFQGSLYCESCGEELKLQVAEAARGEAVSSSADSDAFPQSSAIAGGSDYPSHCESGALCLEAVDLHDYGVEREDVPVAHLVGALLSEALTLDGVAYVAEMVTAEGRTPYQRALHRLWLESFSDQVDEAVLVRALAERAGNCFEVARRVVGDDDSSYVRLRDGAPSWVLDLVREAHGDFLPDDWRYGAIRAAVEFVTESDGDADGGEFADSYADVYTSARLAWVSSNLRRVGYVDAAAEEFGSESGVVDLAGLLGQGQYLEALEVFGSVVASLTARAEGLV